ncbi:hypothetical protein BDR26DRAFT_868924 [Obelidium mucronatum]|nr:hypothetical protein BDR26DRAFT_868924 [Obelidium mucronatum]
MLIGSLPIRDPRTGTFAKDFRNPTLMRALGPIASQYHGEFIVGNQNLLRPIDIAAPAPPAAAAPPRSPEGDWSVTSSTSSAIIKVNAQGDRIYVCSHVGCDQEFQKSSDLRSHIYSTHPDVPSHICTYCLSRFTRKNDLLRHEKTVHSNGPKMDVCSGCGKGRHEKICLPQ